MASSKHLLTVQSREEGGNFHSVWTTVRGQALLIRDKGEGEGGVRGEGEGGGGGGVPNWV